MTAEGSHQCLCTSEQGTKQRVCVTARFGHFSLVVWRHIMAAANFSFKYNFLRMSQSHPSHCQMIFFCVCLVLQFLLFQEYALQFQINRRLSFIKNHILPVVHLMLSFPSTGEGLTVTHVSRTFWHCLVAGVHNVLSTNKSHFQQGTWLHLWCP